MSSDNHYDNLLKKIKHFNKKIKLISSKKEKLKEILENFEREHNILISGIFDADGLEIVTAFQQEYIDQEKLGAYGSKLFDSGLEFVKKVMAEPLTAKTIYEILKDDVKERKTQLKCIILDMAIEKFNAQTLKIEQYPTPIIISPIEGIGIIIMIVEQREHLALIKMNLDNLKENIQNFFS